jgi:hypothetical protein
MERFPRKIIVSTTVVHTVELSAPRGSAGRSG